MADAVAAARYHRTEAVHMLRFLLLTAVSLALAGCTMYEVESNDGLVALPRLPAVDAAAVPEGARVEIVRCFPNSDPRPTIFGVVLKASPEGLALANCTVVGTSMQGTPIVNKVPYVSRLFKSTGVGTETLPVLWISLEQINSVHILEPPPADYVAPSIEISTTEPPRIGVDFDYQADGSEVTGLEAQGATSE